MGDAVAVGGVGGVLSKGGEINFELQQTGEVFLFCFGSRVVVEHARKEKRKKHTFKICSSDKQKNYLSLIVVKIFGFSSLFI